MYAAVRIEREYIDGDDEEPVIGDMDVILFNTMKEATDFVMSIPVGENITWHMLAPDEAHLG